MIVRILHVGSNNDVEIKGIIKIWIYKGVCSKLIMFHNN